MIEKLKIWLPIILGAIVLLGLFLWPKLTNPSRENISKWSDLDVECLANGHVNLAQHIHSHLEVYIDNQRKIVPANVGVVKTCMAEMHTHDDTGKIHIETAYAGKRFNLETFFNLWGESLLKDDYDLEVLADDLPVDDPTSLVLKDNQKIVVKYSILDGSIDKKE